MLYVLLPGRCLLLMRPLWVLPGASLLWSRGGCCQTRWETWDWRLGSVVSALGRVILGSGGNPNARHLELLLEKHAPSFLIPVHFSENCLYLVVMNSSAKKCNPPQTSLPSKFFRSTHCMSIAFLLIFKGVWENCAARSILILLQWVLLVMSIQYLRCYFVLNLTPLYLTCS